MKCPKCEQWNAHGLLQCAYCGETLPETSTWRDSIASRSGKTYIRVDEDGAADPIPDARDVLAGEMAAHQAREEAGRDVLEQLAAEAEDRRMGANHVQVPSAAPVVHDPYFDIPEEGVSSASRVPQGERVILPPVNTYGNRVVLSGSAWQNTRGIDPRGIHTEPEKPTLQTGYHMRGQKGRSRKVNRRRVIRRITWALVFGVLCLVGYFGYTVWAQVEAAEAEKNRPLITASMVDDQAAHTILIPGEDGENIYISNEEISESYPVVGGFATIAIPDYRWYEDKEDIDVETMTVTLRPYRKSLSGKQRPMDPISYDIVIPLSPIEVVTPAITGTDGQEPLTVATAMYSIQLKVRPDSVVNVYRPATAEDNQAAQDGQVIKKNAQGLVQTSISDTVTSDGTLTYNATIQPIGKNTFIFEVRSPYCRPATATVVLNRNYQDIPLDLAVTTYTITNQKILPVSCTTLPKATVRVLSTHTDLKIDNLNSTGEFTFNAVFDHYGENTISIMATYPGLQDSRLDYVISYVPSADEYTPKAWPLNSDGDYSDLVNNLKMRAARSQIYVAVGKIGQWLTNQDGVQLAIVYCSDNGTDRPVVLENKSDKTWNDKDFYSFYCDASGEYNGMPLLTVRYTY